MKKAICVRRPSEEERKDFIIYPDLDINQEYMISNDSIKDRIWVRNLDSKFIGWYPKDCFRTLKEARKEKLLTLR